MTDDLDVMTRLAAANPVAPDEMDDLGRLPAAQSGLDRILATQRSLGSSRSSRHRPARQWTVIGAAVAVVAVVAAIVVGLPNASRHPPQPSHSAVLVVFRTEATGTVVRITDPLAARAELDAQFRAHGFAIHVSAVAASPSAVGTIVYSDFDARPLFAGLCDTGGGTGCPVGFVIPRGFTGPGDVTVGRPARLGEPYETAFQVFGPGEVLHCSPILGMRATTAGHELAAMHLAVRWSDAASSGVQAPSGYVVGGVALSANEVDMTVAASVSRGSQGAAYVAQFRRGC